jgi:hypothetical protein
MEVAGLWMNLGRERCRLPVRRGGEARRRRAMRMNRKYSIRCGIEWNDIVLGCVIIRLRGFISRFTIHQDAYDTQNWWEKGCISRF